MPRAFLFQRLLRDLKRISGQKGAINELEWLRSHLKTGRFSAKLCELIRQRTEQRKPLQYIIGDQPFGELRILMEPPILVPRWETEEWVYKLADLVKKSSNSRIKILDACCGSGCISLLLSCLLPKNCAEIVGLDVSEKAIELSERNKHQNKSLLNNKVSFLQCSILEKAKIFDFDMIVSNPPYVRLNEWNDLEPEVRQWEDPKALIGFGKHSSGFYESIIRNYSTNINLGKQKNVPCFVFEIGDKEQSDHVGELLKHYGNCTRIECWKDARGYERVILGWK